jgi:hypothetical protein
MAKKKTETSIVPVEVVQKAENEAMLMTKQAEAIQVTTTEQEEEAYLALTQIKQAIKTIENKRKEITKPLNASLKAANAMFKKLAAPFVEADRIVRDKVMDFRQAQEEKAQKELERRQKIQAAHEAKGHETHEIIQPKVEVAKTTVTTKRWTFELVDINKVSREYLVLDSVAVNKAIRNGIREIDGLDIFQVEGLRV